MAAQNALNALRADGGSVPTVAQLVDRFGMGLAQVRVGVCAGGVWLADGAELLLISSVARAVSDEWQLTALQRGVVVSVVFAGLAFGSLCSGLIADLMGRRQAILLSYSMVFTFSIMSASVAGLLGLLLARIVVGIGMGMGQPACYAIVAETTPAYWRIVTGSIATALFILGECYSAILIMIDDPYLEDLDWRRLLRLGALPALALGLLSAALLHESPSFLAVKGRNEEAKKVLQSMAADNGAPEAQLPNLEFQRPNVEILPEDASPFSRKVGLVFGRKLCGTTLILMYSTFVLNFCYYGCLYAFPQVLPEIENLQGTPALQLLIGALWEFPGKIAGLLLGLVIARKNLIRLYLFSAIVAQICFVVGAHGGSHWIWESMCLAGYYGLKASEKFGFTAVLTYVSEVFPTELRGTGIAICVGTGRLAGVVTPLAFELVMSMSGGRWALFFMSMTAMSVVNFLLVDLLAFETFGVLLKDSIDEDDIGDPCLATPKRSIVYGSTAGP